MIPWLAAAALAGPGTERADWPALPLDQPVVLSRGWWQVSAGVVRDEWLRAGVGVDSRVGTSVEGRYGVTEQLEVSLADAIVSRPDRGPVLPDAPAFGARWRILRRVGPSTSAAVIGTLRPPWVTGSPTWTAGVAAATVTAPIRWSGEATFTLAPAFEGRDAGDRLAGEGRALLQAGPLAPWLGLSVAAVGWARPDTGPIRPGVESFGVAGLQLNASRGLAAWTEFRGSLLRTAPAVATAGRGLVAGVRVAW